MALILMKHTKTILCKIPTLCQFHLFYQNVTTDITIDYHSNPNVQFQEKTKSRNKKAGKREDNSVLRIRVQLQSHTLWAGDAL